MNFCKYQTNLCFIWTICVTFTISGRSSWQCSECCPFIFRMWRYFDIALSYRFVYIIYVVKIISSTSEAKQMWFWIFMFLRGCFRTRSRANLFFVQEVVFPPSDWYINYLFKNTSVVSNSMSNTIRMQDLHQSGNIQEAICWIAHVCISIFFIVASTSKSESKKCNIIFKKYRKLYSQYWSLCKIVKGMFLQNHLA